MTPVIQEFTLDQAEKGIRGDCVRAAVASILDLPLSEVPHFLQLQTDGGPNWWLQLHAWLHHRGLAMYEVYEDVDPEPGEYYIAAGPSPRGYVSSTEYRTLHAVVYRDEQLAHDPHPDNDGICEVFERWAIRPVPILAAS